MKQPIITKEAQFRECVKRMNQLLKDLDNDIKLYTNLKVTSFDISSSYVSLERRNHEDRTNVISHYFATDLVGE